MSIKFQDQLVNFRGISASSNGTLTTTGSVTFQSNVIAATAAIKGFKASYGNGTFHQVGAVAANIDNVQTNGTVVTYEVSVQFYDGGDRPHSADPVDSSVTVTVIADCQ